MRTLRSMNAVRLHGLWGRSNGRPARAEHARVRGPKNRSLTVAARKCPVAAGKCGVAARKYKDAARGGFTLIEALIAVGLLVVLFAAVSQTFTIATEANGRIRAQAEMFEAAAAFENAVRDKISKLKPGLLIIDSPEPLGSVAPLRADIPNGPQTVTLRHDRLVFIAQGDPGAFESVTDLNVPSVNNANNNVGAVPTPIGTGRAYSSGEALVFFGPSNPDGRQLSMQPLPFIAVNTGISGREWVVSQRLVLLGAPAGAFRSFSEVNFGGFAFQPLLEYPLGGFANGSPDDAIYYGEMDAVQETADQLLTRITSVLLTTGGPVDGLWHLNFAPTSLHTNINADVRPSLGGSSDTAYYYRRAGFSLLPRIADLRIEWTDGSAVDPIPTNLAVPGQPREPATQWFGQFRDTSSNADWDLPDAIGGTEGDVTPKQLWLNAFGPPVVNALQAEVGVYGTGGGYAASVTNQIEQWGAGQVANATGPHHYRVGWLANTWQFRPKALRFTFRVYDSADRIVSDEVVNTTPWQNATPSGLVRRWGQEFSFVVAVP